MKPLKIIEKKIAPYVMYAVYELHKYGENV